MHARMHVGDAVPDAVGMCERVPRPRLCVSALTHVHTRGKSREPQGILGSGSRCIATLFPR